MRTLDLEHKGSLPPRPPAQRSQEPGGSGPSTGRSAQVWLLVTGDRAQKWVLSGQRLAWLCCWLCVNSHVCINTPKAEVGLCLPTPQLSTPFLWGPQGPGLEVQVWPGIHHSNLLTEALYSLLLPFPSLPHCFSLLDNYAFT